MKIHINRETLLKPLCDVEARCRYGRHIVDFQPRINKNNSCSISNDFSVDLGDAVGGSAAAPVECTGDGDDGDSGDGDPESDRRKLKSQKLSYIYRDRSNFCVTEFCSRLN